MISASQNQYLLRVLNFVRKRVTKADFSGVFHYFDTSCRLVVFVGEVDAAVGVLVSIYAGLFHWKVGGPLDGADLSTCEGLELELVLQQLLDRD